jgi:hypothetical protein
MRILEQESDKIKTSEAASQEKQRILEQESDKIKSRRSYASREAKDFGARERQIRRAFGE